jgi:serine/threonine protein kinase
VCFSKENCIGLFVLVFGFGFGFVLYYIIFIFVFIIYISIYIYIIIYYYKGTKQYMPPEYLRKTITEKMDVYALGVCVYYLVYGKFPFSFQDIEDYGKPRTTLSVTFPDDDRSPPFTNIDKFKYIINGCLQLAFIFCSFHLFIYFFYFYIYFFFFIFFFFFFP